MASNGQHADVLIVGGGISGTIAATCLGRQGIRVTLVDRHDTYPRDFRAEHLDGGQIDQLQRLGMLEGLTAGVYKGEIVACGRKGRLIEIGRTINYGIGYNSMVNTARKMLPPNVITVTGRVVDAQVSETIQSVRLADGRLLTGRLLIVATGLGYALCSKLGVSRKSVREAHSLTFGFNMKPLDAPAFEHSYYVYQGKSRAEKIDYLAIFRFGDQTRANLFTFKNYRDPWTRAFRAEPDKLLQASLPGLARVIGNYTVSSSVVVRPMDLYVSEGHRRSGMVLIGDAFQACCPSAGFGITRLLTDIERLCLVYAPAWLRTDGMDRGKIEAFYDDPIKRACDAQASHDAEYRRAVTTEGGLGWAIHRQQVYLRRLARATVGRRLRKMRALARGFGPPGGSQGLPLGYAGGGGDNSA